MSPGTRRPRAALSALFLLALCVCGGTSDAVLVERPIGVDSAGMGEVVNDLGWTVRADAFRVVMEDIELTSGGEPHASLLDPLSAAIFGRAYAHPGHTTGGEVLGELLGRFVIDFAAGDEAVLGEATLVAATYEGASFTFARAGPEDAVAEEDPLFAHTVWIEGVATKGAATLPFTIAVEQDEGRRVEGAAFSYEAREGDEGALGIALLLEDPTEGRTVFDGVDFATLPGDGHVPAEHEASIMLKRALQAHAFWALRSQGERR